MDVAQCTCLCYDPYIGDHCGELQTWVTLRSFSTAITASMAVTLFLEIYDPGNSSTNVQAWVSIGLFIIALSLSQFMP